MRSNVLFFLSVLLILNGCKTYQSQMMGFEDQKVVYADGVNHLEALFLAEQKIERTSYAKSYKTNSAKVLKDRFVEPYADYWFVSFEPKKPRLDFWRYLVVLHKKTGRVIFSDPYVPLDHVNYDWIFNQNSQR